MDDHVRLLRRQYLQLVEPSALSFPASLSSPEVQSAVYSALFAPAAIANPPPERYTTRVLKRLIALLSAESTAAESTAAEQQPPPPPSKKPRVSADHAATRGGEIHEGLLSLYTTLLSQSSTFSPPAAAVAARSHVTYVLPLSPCSGREIGPPVTLLEARSVLSAQGTTGIRTWEAALALSEYLICAHLAWIYKNTAFGAGVGERVLCETDSVLELGAGTGLVAVVAARLGAADVLATDGDEAVCDALRANVKLNGVGDVVAVRRRLWGSGEETRGGVDLVLGADVIYDATALPSLVKELEALFTHSPRARVVISAPIRNEDTFAAFVEACQNSGFALTDRLWTPMVPPMFFYAIADPIRIVHVSGRAAG